MKTFEEIKADASQKLWELKWKAKEKAEKTLQWCSDNKELAIALLSVGVITVREIGKTVRSVNNRLTTERELEKQELSVYDHSLGMYHYLKRPMTAQEKVELKLRMEAGESKIAALVNMGLLDG